MKEVRNNETKRNKNSVYDGDGLQMTKLKYLVHISLEAPSVTHRRDTSISWLGHPKTTRTISIDL